MRSVFWMALFMVFSFVLSGPAFAKSAVHESVEVNSEHSETSESIETERTVYNDENGNSLVVEKNVTAHEGADTDKSVDADGKTVSVTKSVNTQGGNVTVTKTEDGKTETHSVVF